MEVRIGVDKIKIRHSYTDSMNGKAEYAQLHGWVESCLRGDFGIKGSFSKTNPESALSRVYLKLPEGGYLHVQYGLGGKKQSAWFQFNPSRLSVADLAAVKGHLSILLENGFSTLKESGWVSYVEIKIDIRPANFFDYLYVDTSLRSSNSAFELDGTCYLGSKKSHRSFTVYDKSKERQYKGTYAVPTLRAEAKLQGAKGFVLKDAHALPSPFCTLLIMDRALVGKSTHPFVLEFVKRAKTLGCNHQAAAQSFPREQRQLLHQALRGLQPGWWSSKHIWKEFPTSLEWLI